MAFDGAGPSSATADAWSSGAGDHASGPFSGPVNSLLAESFGQPLDGIQVLHGQDDTNRALDAHAHTIGNTISLGGKVRDDARDPFSMEVIAHEVSHALAGGGSGAKLVDGGKDDAGESAAHAASSSFREFIDSGASGPAPALTPAYGGQAMVHRFEAGEHADAVDHATDTLKQAGHDVDPETAKLMEQKITLSNGQTVTQGQITAMMGDFYGAYTKGADGKDHFDPMASFNAMDHADPEEMKKIVAKIKEEQAGVTAQEKGGEQFDPSKAGDLEDITANRKLKTDENGTTTGYSFLELAKMNTNHFNTKDEAGTDNHMGAYGALHAAAMQSAADANDPSASPEAREEAQQRALALEASSQHCLTDRFASGHQFDKQQVIDENGGPSTDANLKVRAVHDDLNENGAKVENQGGTRWNAMGDGHWADDANATNRVHTADAVVASYGDVNAVLKGQKVAPAGDPDHLDKATQDDVNETAHERVPVWNDKLNDRCHQESKETDPHDVMIKNIGEIGVVDASAKRAAALWGQQHPLPDLGPGGPIPDVPSMPGARS